MCDCCKHENKKPLELKHAELLVENPTPMTYGDYNYQPQTPVNLFICRQCGVILGDL